MNRRTALAAGLALPALAAGGAARAQEGETAGTFAGIAMATNGIATALLAPLLLAWLR